MTTVQLSRYPARGRFESVHFANVGSLTSSRKRASIDEQGLLLREGLTERRRSKKSASLPSGTIITQTGRSHKYGELTEKRTKKVRQRMQAKKLLRKFQMAGHIVLLCIKGAKKHKLYNKVYDELSPFIGGLAFHDYESAMEEAMVGVKLLFDRNKFKANKQLRIGDETKRILTSPSENRSTQDIRYAVLSLRNISAFAEYPLRMQQKIAEVGLYEKYDAKRVIVRQDHPASAFYFILSGSVVVMLTEGEAKVSKPVAYLVKGMTFGELAIINHTSRQSTIIAKETLELLSIDIKDFHKIFMSGGEKNVTDPDHEEFLRSMTFLKTWPIEKFHENTDRCIFHYFKRGEILVRDSRYSDWIFVVKSGSLKVLKKLKKVLPFQTSSNETEDKPVKTEKQKREELDIQSKQRRYILPDIHVPLRNVPNGEEKFEQSTVNNDAKASYHDKLHRYGVGGGHDQASNQTVAKKNQSSNLASQSVTSISSTIRLPNIMEDNRPQSWTGETGKRNKMAGIQLRKNAAVTKINPQEDNPTKSKKRVMFNHLKSSPNGKSKKGRKTKKVQQEEAEVKSEMGGRKQQIRTIVDDLDANYRTKFARQELTDADRTPQFVRVQILTKGQVFGVTETLLHDQPGLCVLSNGAECILIHKDLYLQYASDELLRRTRNECCPYPDDDEMQESLQTAINWDAYRKQTFKQTLREVEERRMTPR